MKDTAVIVLAAGGSTRLGSAKQLLVYQGQTLLRRAAATAVEAAQGGPVVVVLGAGAEAMQGELDGLGVAVVENLDWAQGMGGSVRRGVAAPEVSRVRGVLLTLGDQPLVGAGELRKIVEAGHGGDEDVIVAAAYGGTVGVPVWFGRAYLAELGALPEDAGAKGLLRRHGGHVVAVEMPAAAVDVDTREQYEGLLGMGRVIG